MLFKRRPDVLSTMNTRYTADILVRSLRAARNLNFTVENKDSIGFVVFILFQ